jgi:hypothetical protein
MANEAGSEIAEVQDQMDRLLSEVQNLQSQPAECNFGLTRS